MTKSPNISRKDVYRKGFIKFNMIEPQQKEGEGIDFDIMLLYMKIKEAELLEIVDNLDRYDIFSWWDRFNQEMYKLENTKKNMEEEMKLGYIRNRIELSLHLNFWN